MRFTIRVLGAVCSLWAVAAVPQAEGQDMNSRCSAGAPQPDSHSCAIDIWLMPPHDAPPLVEPPTPDPEIPATHPPLERGGAMSCIPDAPTGRAVLAGLGVGALDRVGWALHWLTRLAVHPLSGWAVAVLFFVALAREGAWGRGRRP
jgi:hypothetical protein